MRVYHFLPLNWGIDDLKRRRLKISRLADLNDPFDCRPIPLPTKADRKHLKQLLEIMNEQIGIICFSEQWSNPVQWSHYADRHRGLCLGFEVPEHTAPPVEYRRALSTDIRLQDPADEGSIKLFLTKYRHWQYEKERRLFVNLRKRAVRDGELFFYPFRTGLLAEIIIGAQAPADAVDQVVNVLQPEDRRVPITIARLAYKSYRVVPNKVLTNKLALKMHHDGVEESAPVVVSEA